MTDLLRYDVTGPAGAPVVLLSAGLGGACSYWQPQMAALAAAYRVITYDQRGTGRNPGEVADGVTIADMADDVAAILVDAQAGPCHFIGHALGGLIGMELALRYPARVRSLVLVNAWATLDPHTARCFDVRTEILRASGPAAYIKAQPIFLHPAAWLSQHAERLAEEEARALGYFQGSDNLRRRIAAVRRFDMRDNLAAITAPALVMANRDDMLVPYTSSMLLATALPRAELALFETGGHAGNVTDPAPFDAALLAFLRRQ